MHKCCLCKEQEEGEKVSQAQRVKFGGWEAMKRYSLCTKDALTLQKRTYSAKDTNINIAMDTYQLCERKMCL